MKQVLSTPLVIVLITFGILAHAGPAGAQLTATLGAGLAPVGAPSAPGTTLLFGSAQMPTRWRSQLGLELWWADNHEQVCESAARSQCERTFPEFTGVAPTVSTSVHNVTIGIGVGAFERRYSAREHAFVPGFIGTLGTDIVRMGKLRVSLSVRPFVAPSGRGGTAWLVPVALGLSR